MNPIQYKNEIGRLIIKRTGRIVFKSDTEKEIGFISTGSDGWWYCEIDNHIVKGFTRTQAINECLKVVNKKEET